MVAQNTVIVATSDRNCEINPKVNHRGNLERKSSLVRQVSADKKLVAEMAKKNSAAVFVKTNTRKVFCLRILITQIWILVSLQQFPLV